MTKDKKELSNEEIDKMIEKLKKEMSEEDFKELMDELENMDDDDFDLSDFVDKDKKEVKESNIFFDVLDKDFIYEGTAKIEGGARGKLGSARNVVNGVIQRNLRKSVAAAWSYGMKANPIGAVATVVKMSRTRKNMAYLQKQADNAKDPKEKKKLLDTKEAIKLSSFSSDGSFIIDPIQRNARIKNLQADGKINKNIDLSKEALNKLNKKGKEFGKSDEGKKYKKAQKKELMKARLSQATGISDAKDFVDDVKSEKKYQDSKKKKEEVVKDKDGSEIHQRPKKNSKGNTYVRIKDGKEIGYASKEDFQKAQQRKAKKQNESLIESIDCISLVDYICS